MLSIAKCRELLEDDSRLSDHQVGQLRDQLYSLMNVLFDIYRRVRRDNDQKLRHALKRISAAEKDYLGERAAIREFDGGLDRATAERAAGWDVARRNIH
jgi:hypothetical protein